jgi:CzcA family heavy metal efflux pump
MNLVAAARRRAAAVFLLVAILCAGGVFEVLGMPSAIFPSVTFPVVKVIADSGEAPAAEVVPTVTRPLEQAVLTVPGIRRVLSTTSRGSSELSAQFVWGTDMQVALQRVQAETQRVQPDLPAGTRITVKWMNTAVFPIEGYALTSDTLSQAQLRELADYTLVPALLRIPGVSEVQVQGGRKREFRVELDRAALSGRGLSAGDVVNAVKENNEVVSAGLMEANHELYLTLADGRVHGLAALERISVPLKDGPPARLDQLGKITTADEISFIRTTAGGQPAVLVNLIRQPSADTVAIASAVTRLFKERRDLIPAGARWTQFYDQARFVSSSVGGTRDAIVIGVLLAALVLLVFLRNWRLTIMAVCTIPISVAIVALLLGAFGQSVNLMTLAGVAAALGLIADDAIVVIENIFRHHEQGAGADAAETGIREILPALIGSSLSTTLILVPFALLSGVVGAFFKPLALTMALTLAGSFCVAAVLFPAGVALFGFARSGPAGPLRARLSDHWEHSPMRRVAARAARGLESGYQELVRFFVAHAAPAVIAVAALVAVGYWLYAHLGTDFLPAMDEGSIILDYWTPPGTSLADTNRMLEQIEHDVILKTSGVSTYSRRTGTQLGFFITEPNRGDYVINLKPRGQRPPVDDVIDELRKRIGRVEPAIHTDFGQLLEDNIGDLTGGTPQPIDVRIFGEDQAALQSVARQIAGIARGVSGIEDVFDGIVIAGPALTAKLDPVAAARYGLTTADLDVELGAAVNGTVVDQVRIGERTYDLRVLAQSALPLASIPIRTPSGALLPLKDVASVQTGAPEVEIDRENLATYLSVTARLSARSLGSAMAELRDRIARQVRLGPGMHIEYGGLYEQQQQSFAQLLLVLLAGLVLVAVIVLFEFADWRAPLVTSLCAVAALAGVFGALTLTGLTLNISSYVGAIMMVGIVGENAIFVIHEAELELHRGRQPAEAWALASRRRLRPVAMTILATALALAPLAVAIGEGSQLMQPLAIAVIGGFALSGVLVLLVVPGLYRLLDPHGRLGTR